MYVAVKGGERAIQNSHKLIAEQRRGGQDVPELTIAQIKAQMRFAVHRVMTEGSLYDQDLAALAIKQACGDLVEAIFLLRAFRTTLPRLAMAEPIDTNRMSIQRRISAIYKDIPGGQVLGPTFDYTHRLLDFQLMAEGASDGIEAGGIHDHVQWNGLRSRPDPFGDDLLDGCFRQNDKMHVGLVERL